MLFKRFNAVPHRQTPYPSRSVQSAQSSNPCPKLLMPTSRARPERSLISLTKTSDASPIDPKTRRTAQELLDGSALRVESHVGIRAGDDCLANGSTAEPLIERPR
jgi:hypothetical protein